MSFPFIAPRLKARCGTVTRACTYRWMTRRKRPVPIVEPYTVWSRKKPETYQGNSSRLLRNRRLICQASSGVT